MGLGDLLGGAFDNLFVHGRSDRGLMSLMDEGELVPATVYAVRCIPNSESSEWYYGPDLTPLTGGPLRVTVRQQLPKEPERAHLGATLMVRHLDGQVAIDWPATLERAGAADPAATSLRIRQLKEPIPPGIDDRELNRKRLERGIRADARIDAFAAEVVMGSPTDSYRLDLTVMDGGGGRAVAVGRTRVPPYAAHLLAVGGTVPVAVDPSRPDRVTIDWATAAERAAG